jgi:hypothetical protein
LIEGRGLILGTGLVAGQASRDGGRPAQPVDRYSCADRPNDSKKQ